MFEAAQQGARSATYASLSKEKAEACATARRELTKLDPNHACLPMAVGQEASYWALNSIFEGRGDIQNLMGVPLPTDEQGLACARAIGITQAMQDGTEPIPPEWAM